MIPTVVTAAQARAFGISRHAVRHRVAREWWQPMMRGIYLTHSGTAGEEDWHAAAMLYARSSDAALSGAAGLRRHGMPGPHPGPALLVLVPSDCSRQSARPVTIRHARSLPRTIMTYPRIPVAMVSRCVVDACVGARDLRAVRQTVATAVQGGRCFLEDIIEELDRISPRGTQLLRQAIAEVAAGAESAAEAEVAELMRAAGISGFRQNVGIFDSTGQHVARADFCWDHLAAILEIDSRLWHLTPASWQATLSRHNRLEAAGYAVLHCAPAEIRRNPDAFVRQVRDWLATRHDQFRLQPPIIGPGRN